VILNPDLGCDINLIIDQYQGYKPNLKTGIKQGADLGYLL